MGVIISLAFLTVMLWIGFQLTGALLTACIWLFIKVPVALVLWGIGVVCCCTLILIPVGLGLFKTGFRLIVPGI